MSDMQNAMTIGSTETATPAANVCMRQMPLTFLKAGESASVLKVRGSGEVHRHLENLGFTPGAAVRVVNELAGNLIVEIKGAQVALDRASASKIVTC